MILEILGGGGGAVPPTLAPREGRFSFGVDKNRSQWLKFWFVPQRVHPKLRSPF